MSMAELVSALAKAQAEMKHAKLDATNPHFRSRYATLQSVIDAVRPALTKHGIAYVQRFVPVESGVGIETVFHMGESQLETGVVVVPVDKATAQAMGSAITYAKRYSLAAACGIAAEEDDDGNAATDKAPTTITTEQAAWIKSALQATNSDVEAFLKMAGTTSVDEMAPKTYPMARKALEKKAAAMNMELPA